MNIIDRVIAAVAPEAGLRRARARAQITLVRAYEGAQRGRRTQGWRTSASGPKTEVQFGRNLLRQRARDLVRNNGWAARAVAVKVANQVGTGIRPRAATASPELNAKIDAAFAAWAATCAPDSGGDFYAMQALAARARSESGEALILLDRGSSAAGRVRLSLQVLEGDWIDDTSGITVPGRDGWCDGIQFDKHGRRIAYRLWETAPHEASTTTTPHGSRTVPAQDVIHLYRQDRPGQVRGVPDVASVILRMRDLDDYHDAALLLAKIQACLGVFITQADGAGGATLGTPGTDGSGNRIEEIAPGMVGYLAPGEEPHFLAPQGSGPFAEYTRISLHLIAVAHGITYHQLTGDLSQANYSSLRAGSLEFRRQIEQDQHLLLIPMMCQPIWRAFLEQAVLAGDLPREALGAAAEWSPPRFEMVDPIKDTSAAIMQVRAGAMTWGQFVAEFGWDPRSQLNEIAQWAKLAKDLGVILDTDPSVITAGGNAVDAKQLAAIVLAAQGNANA